MSRTSPIPSSRSCSAAWEQPSGGPRHRHAPPDSSVADAGVAAVEECLLHCFDIHEGLGPFTREPRRCRFHDLPHTSTHFISCQDLQAALVAYVRKTIYDRREAIFTSKGAVTQNSSERVGSVRLLYRGKGVNMDGVHHAAATDCGLLHVNGTVLAVFDAVLTANGVADARLREYGTWQLDVHRKLGLPVSTQQIDEWQKDIEWRARRSMKRRTEAYKKRRAAMRKQQKQRRNAERKAASREHTYKEEENVAGGKGKGEAGACLCGKMAACCNCACPYLFVQRCHALLVATAGSWPQDVCGVCRVTQGGKRRWMVMKWAQEVM